MSSANKHCKFCEVLRGRLYLHLQEPELSQVSLFFAAAGVPTVAPGQIWKWGTGPARSARKKTFLAVPLHFFVLKVQLVVLVSAFVMVSTVWSVSWLLFFYSRCPPCPAICKSGGTCPSCPMESAPLVLLCCFLCDLYLMFALRPLWHLIFLLSPRYKCASI